MHEIELTSLAFGGDAVGRLEGKVIFVPLGAAGDRALVRVVKEQASYYRGELVRLLSPGPGRREPPCPLATLCGGCQWQHLLYSHQITAKEEFLGSVKQIAGGGADPAPEEAIRIHPLAPAPEELGYRRRVRMHWSSSGKGTVTLGFFKRRSRELLDVPCCPLLTTEVARGVEACRERLARLPSARGTLSVLAGEEGQVHVSVRIRKGQAQWILHLDGLEQEGPVIGWQARVGRESFRGGSGAVHLLRDPLLLGSAAAFAQANAPQDARLRQCVAAWAGGPRVLELFAGVGNLTLALAGQAEAVTAVESSPAGAELLRRNAEANKGRVIVLQQNAKAALERLSDQGRRFHTVVLDPPREGCRGLGEKLAATGAQRIVYVSCDPMTLARDVGELQTHGFWATQAQPVDMMPQTFHLEAVVLLERRPAA